MYVSMYVYKYIYMYVFFLQLWLSLNAQIILIMTKRSSAHQRPNLDCTLYILGQSLKWFTILALDNSPCLSQDFWPLLAISNCFFSNIRKLSSFKTKERQLIPMQHTRLYTVCKRIAITLLDERVAAHTGYIYVCMYIYMCVCIYMYVCMYTYLCVYI